MLLLLVGNQGFGKATLGGFAIRVGVIVRPDLLVAVLLILCLAWAAVSAATYKESDSDQISYFELGHI